MDNSQSKLMKIEDRTFWLMNMDEGGQKSIQVNE